MVFALEIMVQARFLDMAGLGDVIHAGFGKPSGGKHMPGLLQNGFLADAMKDGIQRFHAINLPCGRLIVKDNLVLYSLLW